MPIRDMRFAVVLTPLACLSACMPLPESAAPPPRVAGMAGLAPAGPQAPVQPAEMARATGGVFSGITLEGVAFDSRRHRLVVVDQTGGPDTQFADARAAGQSVGGLAAANAGFFTPEGNPLGLVVSSGKRSGAWNGASALGSGVWREDSSGHAAIMRRETLGRSGALGARQLIQVGPMLVENGHPVPGLDAAKSRVRTLLVWDGACRWWLGRASACTLSELAAALSRGQPAGWPVRHALNLDGGRSSDLWISAAVAGGPLTRRAPWNRPVRNFLVLMPGKREM
jgi:hypothetical protein